MRSRVEIEKSPKTIEQLQLEVLLDIRDLLKGDECQITSTSAIEPVKKPEPELSPSPNKDLQKVEQTQKEPEKSATKSPKPSKTLGKASSVKDAGSAARGG